MRRRWFRVDSKTAISILVSILLAISGYLYTWEKDRRATRHHENLERVNRQLRELYGPLYALAVVSDRTWKEFRRQNRPDVAFFGEGRPPSDEEKRVWRLWITEVFMPLNREMERVILKNADLLVESEMPESMLKLSAHIAGYKPVLKAWEEKDFSRLTSLFNYPNEIVDYAKKDYEVLTRKQKELLGEISSR